MIEILHIYTNSLQINKYLLYFKIILLNIQLYL